MTRTILILVALLALPSLASAQQSFPIPAGGFDGSIELSGEYRLNLSMIGAAEVDAEGTTLSQWPVLDNRLRTRFDINLEFIKLSTEWDLFSGQLVGEDWGIPGDMHAGRRHLVASQDGISALRFLPRRGAVSFSFPTAIVEVGLVTSDWGLGMLSNGGDRTPYFGRNDYGDRVLRARLTLRPLLLNKKTKEHPKAGGLFTTFAFDYVVEDEQASIRDNQRALQGTVAILYQEPNHCRHGLYLVYRHQEELIDGRTTDAFVIDALVDQWFDLPGGWRLRGAGEGVFIGGRTNRAVSWNAPEELSVLSGGITGLAEVRSPNDVFGGTLRAGWASADGNPDDGVTSDFSFDRDFDAGMVLFDELMAGVEVATYNLITDPENTGTPPDGADGLVTEGAVRRTLFVQPVLRGSPLAFLDLQLGVLLAWSSGPVVQPFYTGRSGGVPTNHHNNASEGRFLGAETDIAITARIPFKGSIKEKAAPGVPLFETQLQIGTLMTGPALRGLQGESGRLGKLMLTGRLEW